MTVDATREYLCINKLTCEKEENIIVQGDMIVPDAKPDILNTISTTGNICIYKKEVMDGKIRIDGCVNLYIMYLADNEESSVRALNTSIDFSETIVIANCVEDSDADIRLKIKNIECKVLNGRKISLKALVETKIKIYSNENVEIINQINNNKIECLEKNISLNSLVGKGTTKAYVKENVTCDANDNIAEILRVDLNLIDTDVKICYNKVLAKSEAEVTIMYLTEDNRINTMTARLPVVGFVDMQGIKEEDICDVDYEIKNLIIANYPLAMTSHIKLNNIEDHSAYVEAEIEICCTAYEEKQINMIEDLYSVEGDLEFNQNDVVTISNKQNRKETCKIREKVSMPEVNENNIISVTCTPNINKESKMNSKIMYEGEVELNVIFTDNSTVGINSKIINIPFEFKIDNVQDAENLEINTRMETANLECIAQNSGEISCNLDLVFDVNMYKNTRLNVIDKIEMADNRDIDEYSVIIYIVKKGDTLWEIAKRFRSTVRDIVRVNGIENPNRINIGDKLYIPIYNLGIQENSEANLVTSYA